MPKVLPTLLVLGLVFCAASMSKDDSPVNMELKGPYTSSQKKLAVSVMVKAYCNEKKLRGENEFDLKTLFDDALKRNELSVNLQYIPEVTKEFNASIQNDSCS